MSNVMTISKRTASGLEEVLRTLLLDADNKIPADRLRIVGALAEGAIIEQGSNANGEWTRYADGTQICYNRTTIIIPPGETDVREDTITYPASFMEVPATSLTGARSEITKIVLYSMDSINFIPRITINSAKNETFLANFHYIAIGKWK